MFHNQSFSTPRQDWMHAGLWRTPVQIRRRVFDGGDGRRLAYGAPVPLSEAVRVALKLLEREGVDICPVDPHGGIATIREVDILKLARRPDYPFTSVRN